MLSRELPNDLVTNGTPVGLLSWTEPKIDLMETNIVVGCKNGNLVILCPKLNTTTEHGKTSKNFGLTRPQKIVDLKVDLKAMAFPKIPRQVAVLSSNNEVFLVNHLQTITHTIKIGQIGSRSICFAEIRGFDYFVVLSDSHLTTFNTHNKENSHQVGIQQSDQM